MVLVGLMIPTVKYITNPSTFFDILKFASEDVKLNEIWAGVFGPLNFDYYDLPGGLGTNLIRSRINWGDVEREENSYIWDDEEIRMMDQYVESGNRVVPVIKIRGGKHDFWAVDSPLNKEERDNVIHDCSWMPKDTQDRFNRKYGYSKTYYDFIVQILNRYKGKIEMIVIENEPDAVGFWCDSGDPVNDMKGYIKILRTAKKAASDVDLNVEVVDGGVCSKAVPYSMVKNYLNQGLDQKALDFWHGTMKHNKNLETTSLRVLKRFFNNNEAALTKIERVDYLFDYLPSVSKVINFHYKEDVEYYSEIIDYIRSRVGNNVQLMNNELGTKQKPAENIYDEAAKSTVKFLVYSYVFNVKPIIWYARDHGEYSAIGILDENGIHEDWETYKALKTGLKFLNKEFIRVQDVSNDKLFQYLFATEKESIKVVWNKTGFQESIDLPEKCEVYSYLGDRIQGETTMELPVFIVCPNIVNGGDFECRPRFSKCLDKKTMVYCGDDAKWGDPIDCFQNEWCVTNKCELMSPQDPSPSFKPSHWK